MPFTLRQLMCTAPLWACFSLAAQAQTASDACTANPADVTPPYTLWLDQNVNVNDALGSGWMLLAPIHWRCIRNADAHTTLAAQAVVTVDGNGITSGELVTHAGETYRRFVLQQGGETVGYIARWRSTIAGQSGNWRPVTLAIAQDDANAAPVHVQAAPNATYRVSFEVQVRMFKTHAASPTLNASMNFAPFSAALSTQRKLGGTTTNEDLQPAQAPNVTLRFKHVNQACVTPDVHVKLPPVGLTPDMTAVWSTGPIMAFMVEFKNCPAYLNGIDYKFQSIPHQTITNGVLPLMTTSTAAGVGIQVLDGGGSPLKFDFWYALTAYDPSADAATYAVPLAARAIRTSGALRPGSMHAAMNVTLEYK